MNGLSILSDDVTQRLAWVLIHFLWQGMLVAAIFSVMLWLTRVRNPAIRYRLGLVALLAMVVLPVSTFFALRADRMSVAMEELPRSPEPPTAVPDMTQFASWKNPATDTDAAHRVSGRDVALIAIAASEEQTAPEAERPESQRPDPTWTVPEIAVTESAAHPVNSRVAWRRAPAWIVAGWLTGVGIFSLRLLLGGIGLWRLRRNVAAIPDWMEKRIGSLVTAMQVTRPIIQLSHRVTEAVATGLVKPLILIPVAWVTDLSPEAIEDVIAHELAHIRRGDLWVNLFQRIVETVLFYHPAVWWLSRRLRIDRELCCDALVVRTLRNPLRYAETLQRIGHISLANRQRHSHAVQDAQMLSVSIGSTPQILLHRIRAILSPPPPRGGASTASLAGLLPLVATCLVGWSFASRPPAPEIQEPPAATVLSADANTPADSPPSQNAVEQTVYRGQVVVEDGAPLPADLKLTRRLNGDSFEETCEIPVQPNGAFQFHADPARASVRFSMAAKGFAPFDSRWLKLDEPFVLTLSRGATVRLRLVTPQKSEALTGAVSLIVPWYDDDEQGTFPVASNGDVFIRNCPRATVKFDVLVPGFEEVRIHRLVADDLTIDVPLQPARTTRLRVISAKNGRPVAGARVRLFRRTRADSLLMPLEHFGEGPVWGVSNAEGRVELTTLCSIDPVPTNDPGPAVYAFRIDAQDHAPRYLGDVRADSDLGDFPLEEALEVRGEFVRDPAQPERVSLQVRQPTVALGGAGDSGWWTTVPVAEVAGKLNFHLTGLRPGPLELFAVFADPKQPKNGHGTIAQLQFHGKLNGSSSNLIISRDSIVPGDNNLISLQKSLLPGDRGTRSNVPDSIVGQLLPISRVTEETSETIGFQQTTPRRQTLFAWSSTAPIQHLGGYVRWELFVMQDGTVMVPGSSNDEAGIHHKLSTSQLNELKQLLEKQSELFNPNLPAHVDQHDAWRNGHETMYYTKDSVTRSYSHWGTSRAVSIPEPNDITVDKETGFRLLAEFVRRLKADAAFGGPEERARFREIAQAAISVAIPGAVVPEAGWSSTITRVDGTREFWFRSDQANATVTLIQPVHGEVYVERIEQQGQRLPLGKSGTAKNAAGPQDSSAISTTAVNVAQAPVGVPGTKAATETNIVVAEVADFNGRVVDADGTGVAGAEVRLFKSTGGKEGVQPKLIATVQSGNDGVFRFGAIHPENCTVWVSVPGKGIGTRATSTQGPPPNSMGLPDEAVPQGSPDRFRIRLVQNTKPIRIVDSHSQPVAGAKVSVMLIQAYLYRFDNRKYQESVARQFGMSVSDLQNYSMSRTLFDAPPADLKRAFEGGTDANGNVIFSGIEPDKIRRLVVETETHGRQNFTVTKYSFGQHPDDLTFRLVPAGRIEGQLSLDVRAQATGFRLEGLKLSFKTTVPDVAIKRETAVNRRLPPLPEPATTSEGRGEAVVDANGRFIVPMIASGLVELADPLPVDSSLYIDQMPRTQLDPGKTMRLEGSINQGIHVRGRVRLRGSDEPVASRSIALTSFPGTNFGIQRTRFVVTDAAGRFEGYVPPGLLEYWLNGSVDGFTTVYALEHNHPRASSGMHFRVPDGVESVDLPSVELVPQKLRQGTLLDLKGKPAEPNWDVFGYPAEGLFQSAHGKTADEGKFTLSFAEPYPPATFVAKIDAWHAKPGSDRRRYRLKIVSENPFIVQMAAVDPPLTQQVNSTARLPEKVSRDIDQVRQIRIKEHDREAARKLQGQWKLTLPRGFVYQAKINPQPDGRLRLTGAVNFNGIYTLSKGRLELVETSGSGITDFVWQVQDDGSLKLTYEEHSVGATYRGAVLAPVPVTSAVPVTPVPAAVAKDGDSVSQAGATLRGRVTLKGPIPNVSAITIQPSLRLLNPRSTKDELTNAETIAKAPKVEIPDDSLIVSKTRGVANVAVYLRQVPQGWTPNDSPNDPVKLKVDSFRFQPRISFIRVGQSLQIMNSLEEPTNIRVLPPRSNPFNRLVAKDSVLDIPKAFSHPERIPVRINSDVHPWMMSWLLVQDHPFVAISNVDGQFEIGNLPAGEHHFVVWHERCGYLDKDLVVRVEDGKQLELGLEYDAGRFQPDPPRAATPVAPPAP